MKFHDDFGYGIEKWFWRAPLKWFVRELSFNLEPDSYTLDVQFTWPVPVHWLLGIPRKLLTWDQTWKWCDDCKRWTHMYWDDGDWWC